MRLFFTVSKEEYEQIQKEAGLAPLSRYVRSKFFSPEVDNIRKSSSIKEWVDFLSSISQLDERWKKFQSDCKYMQNSLENVFIKRFPL